MLSKKSFNLSSFFQSTISETMGRKVPTSSTSAPAPAPASRKTAANSTNRRIVIVGGGVIGACCAYYLRQKGFTNIVIVEKESIACAASG